MADIDALLNRWQTAGVLDPAGASRIRAYESERAQPSGLRWQGMVALILGALLLACGVVLFVSAHWDQMGPGARYLLVLGMVAVFHLGGGWAGARYRGLSTALHAVGTISTGAAIALVGQIFNIQEHWPAAILLWAIAAAAGWMLLRDEAQQVLTLLLFPAWVLSEFEFAADGHVGQDVYLGRFLMVWAVLYLTVFLGSKRKIAQGILFAVAAIASLVGVVLMVGSWNSWGSQAALPFHLQVWGWVDIAVLPLAFCFFKLRKTLVPVGTAVVFSLALPWCVRTWTERGDFCCSYTHQEPGIAAHALVAVFCVFAIWWAVRQGSKALVNLGVVGFAITVAWFYFSDIMDKFSRSLGLIGLGVLFLAGGWALEKMRRRLLTRMKDEATAPKEAR